MLFQLFPDYLHLPTYPTLFFHMLSIFKIRKQANKETNKSEKKKIRKHRKPVFVHTERGLREREKESKRKSKGEREIPNSPKLETTINK